MRSTSTRAERAIRPHVAEPLGLDRRGRPPGASTRSSTRGWPARRGCTPWSAATIRAAAGLRLRRRRPGAWLRRRRRARLPAVIVPSGAGVMSAIGFLAAPIAADAVRSRLEPVDDETLVRVEPLFRELEQQNAEVLGHSGVTDIQTDQQARRQRRGRHRIWPRPRRRDRDPLRPRRRKGRGHRHRRRQPPLRRATLNGPASSRA